MVCIHLQASLFGELGKRRFALFGEPRRGNHFSRRMIYEGDRVNDATAMETSESMRRVLYDGQRV